MILCLTFLKRRLIDFNFLIEEVCFCASANELRAQDVSFTDY